MGLAVGDVDLAPVHQHLVAGPDLEIAVQDHMGVQALEGMADLHRAGRGDPGLPQPAVNHRMSSRLSAASDINMAKTSRLSGPNPTSSTRQFVAGSTSARWPSAQAASVTGVS